MTTNNSEINRFLRQPGPTLGSDKISTLEQEFGQIPSSYSAFLRCENGGVAQSSDARMDGFLFYGVGAGPSSLEDEWREFGVSRCTPTLPIGESLNGEQLFLDRLSGEVCLDGKYFKMPLSVFLVKYFDRINTGKSVVGMIANERIEDLEEAIRSGEIDTNSVLEKGMSLPQFAAFLGKKRVFKLLHENGFSLSGSMHSALTGPGVSRSLIALLVDCGVGLDGADAQGRLLCDLDSPWYEEAKALVARRSDVK